MSCDAKSAHVGSALSCIEILYSLFRARSDKRPPVDKIILSKGHAAMALYATAAGFGELPESELENYLGDGTHLWGHPSRSARHPFIHWSTGSLGHGLPAATGLAYAKQRLKKEDAGLTAVVLSDGECDEGTNWESALFAGHHQLSRLLAVIDYNKIQSFGRCDDVLSLEPLADKWRAFGWKVLEADGHDVGQMGRLLVEDIAASTSPVCLIAHTIKGKGIPAIENTLASHYKPITPEQLKGFADEK